MSGRVSRETVREIYERPLLDLVFEAARVHRLEHPAGEVQLSTLLSVKTGACAEDCSYCAQSSRYKTGIEPEPLMPVDEVVHKAREAKESGATRFCMGAAWREVRDQDLPKLEAMVSSVKALGMETCMTLGMMKPGQASRLKDAGLDYYNHNLDTSPEFYGDVISTRAYQDRLDTLQAVREAGMKVCSGGILGMGERREDRIGLLAELASLAQAPESVPINRLVPMPGTPLEGQPLIDNFEFLRAIATARILMPKAAVRLSAGREGMSEEMQALCFMAGANSIFYGEKLLTAPNQAQNEDQKLLEKLGLKAERTAPQGVAGSVR